MHQELNPAIRFIFSFLRKKEKDAAPDTSGSGLRVLFSKHFLCISK
jgi:hypothetical protein